jgi:polyribonucleotide nucleotidyltransferase
MINVRLKMGYRGEIIDCNQLDYYMENMARKYNISDKDIDSIYSEISNILGNLPKKPISFDDYDDYREQAMEDFRNEFEEWAEEDLTDKIEKRITEELSDEIKKRVETEITKEVRATALRGLKNEIIATYESKLVQEYQRGYKEGRQVSASFDFEKP